MRKSRYSEQQIIGILREHEARASVADVSRHHGVSEQTIYRWKQKYGGMETSELRRLKQLEAESARLKRLVADQALYTQMLKELLEKSGDAIRTAQDGGASESALSRLRTGCVPARRSFPLDNALPAAESR
jgi:putative transposase